MASVVDELIVVLGLDPADFNAGRKAAAEDLRKMRDEFRHGATEIEDRTKVTSRFFSELRGQVLLLYGAFTAGRGIKDFIIDTTRTTAEMGRLAPQLAETTKELGAWRYVAEKTGGTAEGITGSIQGLVQSFVELQATGHSAITPFMRALGMQLSDFDPTKINSFLLKLADQAALDTKQHGAPHAAFLLKGLGLDQGTISLILMGRARIEQLLAEARKNAPTDADAAAAQKLQDAWAQLEQASAKLGRQLLTEFGPALVRALEAVTSFFEDLGRPENKDELHALFFGLSAISAILSVSFVAGFVRATAALLGFSSAARTASAAAGTRGLLGVLGGIATLGGAAGGIAAWGSEKVAHRMGIRGTADIMLGTWTPTPDLSMSGVIQGARSVLGGGINSSTPSDIQSMMAETDRMLGLPAGSTAGQIFAESRNNPNALSGAGAMGLAQIMPKTLAAMNRRFGRTMNPYDPTDAILMNREIMRENLAHFGNYGDALKAYNGGWDRSKWGNAETSAYPGRVLAARGRLPSMASHGASAAGSHSTSIRTSSWNQTIHKVEVHSKATDANGVARDMNTALRNHGIAAQANYGQN